VTDKEQQLSNAGNQFRMKCPVCSRQFYVETTSSRIPKHAKKEESEKDPQYTPCGGTGGRGIVAGTRTTRFEELR
jgi:hypothetical protein